MQPREHHFFFAKKLLPNQLFQSPDKMFAELTGPKREAFLMFLWQEAARSANAPLPHVALDGDKLAKLEVVGAIKSGDKEVVVLSMPPAINPNEAMFIAAVRGPTGVSVYFYERCLDQPGTGAHATDAVLAEVRANGMRINHGFKPGLTLDAFKASLGEALEMSLAGLETSLPPITMEAFMGQGPAPQQARQAQRKPAKGVGDPLEKLCAVRAGLPLAMFVLSFALGSILGPVWMILRVVYMLLALGIGVLLLVWLHQLYSARPGQMKYSPGMAVGGWFIPGANIVLPALIVRDAWRATVGPAGSGIVIVWWVFWVLEIFVQLLRGAGFTVVRSVGDVTGESTYGMIARQTFDLPSGIAPLIGTLWSYSGVTISVAAYGLLWHIVKNINAKA